MPQCTSHKTELGEQLCGPKFLNKMTLQEADDFVKGLASWTEDIYGKCDAVCWLRQVNFPQLSISNSMAGTAGAVSLLVLERL